MNIVIIGAGIGGLTAGLCLSKAGHNVTVVERAAQFLDVGAGIQCGANALAVMNYLGLLDRIKKLSVAPKCVEFRDYQSGDVLHSMTLGDVYEQTYHAPYLNIHRSDLHRVLLDAFTANSNNSLVLGHEFESYSETADSVIIKYTNGFQNQADLLVGADGIKSQVRKQEFSIANPRFTGNLAWRGVVPVERLPEGWMNTLVSNFVGPKKHMVLYYLRDKSLVNFVGVVEKSTDSDSSWFSNGPWQELKNDFDGWHPMVSSVIDAVNKDSCYRWALYDHSPLEQWSSKRVTLLGDAAHATLPFMAAGAAMAIEDARILERSIDQVASLPEALSLYQNNRLARTSKVQAMSAKAGHLYHFNSSLMRKAAFTALKLMGGKQQAFLPDYDANTITLK